MHLTEPSVSCATGNECTGLPAQHGHAGPSGARHPLGPRFRGCGQALLCLCSSHALPSVCMHCAVIQEERTAVQPAAHQAAEAHNSTLCTEQPALELPARHAGVRCRAVQATGGATAAQAPGSRWATTGRTPQPPWQPWGSRAGGLVSLPAGWASPATARAASPTSAWTRASQVRRPAPSRAAHEQKGAAGGSAAPATPEACMEV